MSELKPCPFCGNNPTLLNLAGWELMCSCGADMVLRLPNRAGLIAAWNRRAIIDPPAQGEAVAKLHSLMKVIGGMFGEVAANGSLCGYNAAVAMSQLAEIEEAIQPAGEAVSVPSNEQIEALAHRTCSKYEHGAFPTFMFERHTLADFARKLLDGREG